MTTQKERDKIVVILMRQKKDALRHTGNRNANHPNMGSWRKKQESIAQQARQIHSRTERKICRLGRKKKRQKKSGITGVFVCWEKKEEDMQDKTSVA